MKRVKGVRAYPAISADMGPPRATLDPAVRVRAREYGHCARAGPGSRLHPGTAQHAAAVQPDLLHDRMAAQA
ncbi:hypothetical protein GCM10009693_12300 [Leucobacter chromiireducens subsp. chromiireducens]